MREEQHVLLRECGERLHLCEMPAVDYTQAGSCTELGPVGCAPQPLQVLSKERVNGCATVHHGVGKNDGTMAHTVSHFHTSLHVLQNL